MIISFIGHSFVPSNGRIKEIVKEQIRKYAYCVKDVMCYLGGYGDFDEICACACRELKKEREGVELFYVTPYIDLRWQQKIKEMHNLKLYDGSVYPPIERAPLKYAIVKRNEWMMITADLVIAYINKNSGGAYLAFKYAKRKQKTIVNICDFL